MIHNRWFSIAHHTSHPLAQHNSPWLTTTCSALHTINHNHLLSTTHHDSQPPVFFLHPNLKIKKATENTVCNIWSQCALWLWVMVCNAEPVSVNHGGLCWASGCESCVLYWTEPLWIMLFYTEPIVFELWCVMPLSITHHDSHPWHSIAHHDSQPLAYHSKQWFTVTGSI
jgi:hypothetical protein